MNRVRINFSLLTMLLVMTSIAGAHDVHNGPSGYGYEPGYAGAIERHDKPRSCCYSGEQLWRNGSYPANARHDVMRENKSSYFKQGMMTDNPWAGSGWSRTVSQRPDNRQRGYSRQYIRPVSTGNYYPVYRGLSNMTVPAGFYNAGDPYMYPWMGSGLFPFTVPFGLMPAW